MQPFHTINVSEMCGEVVLSQGVILLDQSGLEGGFSLAGAACERVDDLSLFVS